MALCVGVCVPGCSVKTTTFDIVDHPRDGPPKRFRETFDDAYHAMDDRGNIDIVLRRERRGAAPSEDPITQIIHIHSVWRCIPGTTVADAAQINATVRYVITGGAVHTVLEGGGSVFFKQSDGGDTLTGRLEYASLTPSRRHSVAAPLFDSAELTGVFRTIRDRRRVVRTINEIERLTVGSSTSP